MDIDRLSEMRNRMEAMNHDAEDASNIITHRLRDLEMLLEALDAVEQVQNVLDGEMFELPA